MQIAGHQPRELKRNSSNNSKVDRSIYVSNDLAKPRREITSRCFLLLAAKVHAALQSQQASYCGELVEGYSNKQICSPGAAELADNTLRSRSFLKITGLVMTRESCAALCMWASATTDLKGMPNLGF